MKSLESACVARPLCTHHIGTSALLIGPRAYTAIFAVGSRDQLFLALRLAYLEDFAKNADPAPFIGDDLFTSFDEDRTAVSCRP